MVDAAGDSDDEADFTKMDLVGIIYLFVYLFICLFIYLLALFNEY